MRQAFLFISICLAACITGISSAWLTLEGDLKFDKINLGQWEIWPTAGETASDPYSKAYLARKGVSWMGITEGLAFFARKDDSGDSLDSACSYSLRGKIPRGRLWTLTSQPTNLSARDNAHYITSADTIWEEDEQLVIAISKTAQPGNWLRVSGSDEFNLVLRIYDTPLTSGALDAAIKTPTIRKENCL